MRRLGLCPPFVAWLYSESLDSAPQSAELKAPAISSRNEEQEPGARLTEISGLTIHALWREGDADSVGLREDELAAVLLAVGDKYNYGVAPGVIATREQVGTFWRTLRLQDLALAHACAL